MVFASGVDSALRSSFAPFLPGTAYQIRFSANDDGFLYQGSEALLLGPFIPGLQTSPTQVSRIFGYGVSTEYRTCRLARSTILLIGGAHSSSRSPAA